MKKCWFWMESISSGNIRGFVCIYRLEKWGKKKPKTTVFCNYCKLRRYFISLSSGNFRENYYVKFDYIFIEDIFNFPPAILEDLGTLMNYQWFWSKFCFLKFSFILVHFPLWNMLKKWWFIALSKKNINIYGVLP